MQKSIKITFPVKKKNQDDTYRTMAIYTESEGGRFFILQETNRKLQRLHHTVTEGSLIEDLITDEIFKCIGVTFTEGKCKFPIMQVIPV